MVYVMYSTGFTDKDKSLEYWFGYLNTKRIWRTCSEMS